MIKASEINVDKVQNYEGYFPKWNSDVEIVIRERRRITVRGFN